MNVNELQVVECGGQRVLTTHQLAESYGTSVDALTRNFNRNKDRYVEGKHYICLEGAEKRDFVNLGQIERSLINAQKLYLWTEKGTLLHAKSLNTDIAWEVYDRLVDSYFNVRQITSNDLSPNLQLMKSLVQEMERKELADKERDRKIEQAQDVANRAIENTQTIKDAVSPIMDNWRVEINRKVRKIQKDSGIPFMELTTQMYKELERRAGCNLNTRLNNKKDRMRENGASATRINSTRKLDCIEDDKKLKEIYTKIVSEYEIRFCA